MSINVGDRINKLIVLERIGKTKDRQGIFNCLCDCGNIKAIRMSGLYNAISCGCYRKENNKIISLKHGESHSTKEYRAWMNMKRRIFYPTKKDGPNYKLNNIKIHESWLYSFENFLKDLGRAPSKRHSLDRINNLGNYEPGNCRWATTFEQRHNR